MISGFYIYKNLEKKFNIPGYKEFMHKNFSFNIKFNEKFYNDSLVIDDNEIMLFLDGAILNKSDIVNQESCTFNEYLKNSYIKKGIKFINELRGPFFGFCFDKTRDRLEIFTSHNGEKAIYYNDDVNYFIVSSSLDITVRYLKTLDYSLIINTTAIKELLSLGYLLSNHTIISNIKRLIGGKLLELSENKLIEYRYHKYSSNPVLNDDLDNLIEKFDVLYTQAINRILLKNKEYGFNNVADLSGGLDSRMVNFVLKKLNANNIIATCYSQSKTADHKISKKVASYLNIKHIFQPLNKGTFLFDIDEMVSLTEAQSIYFIGTGAYKLFKKNYTSDWGISISGAFASNINGLLTEGMEHTDPSLTTIRYSKLIDFSFKLDNLEEFDTFEEFNTYSFNLKLIYESLRIRRNYTYAISPMADVDVAEFIARVPIKYRKKRILLKKWIINKYPEAAKFTWQHTMKPLTHEDKIYIPKLLNSFSIFLKRAINKFFKLIGLNFALYIKDDMNPFALWYRNNKKLRIFIKNYYENNIQFVPTENHKYINEYMRSDNPIDKLLAINVIAGIKKFLN